MTQPLWTAEAAAAATGGRATGDFAADSVSIDTRSLKPGALFVALRDVRDGHDFVRQALDAGAAAALVSHIPEGCSEADPLLIVPDVLEGLEALARAARARTRAKVIGVTGSVGKTSTKEMLRVVLGGQGQVHAAEASYNNHWGVPLTLARMPEDCDFAVIEIGMNHPGEIAPLARLARPDVAMITTVAPAHMAAFRNLEAIAEEKASIFEGVAPGGTTIVPLGLPVSGILETEGRARGQHCITFGAAEEADWRLLHVRTGPENTVVEASHRGAERHGKDLSGGAIHPLLFKLATPGRHFAMNAMAVLAAAQALGCDVAVAALDIGRWKPADGRGTRETVLLDAVEELSFLLIDDAFNANPASLTAALEVLAASAPLDGVGRVPKGRRIAVLGDMLELGPEEAALHAAVARDPAMGKIDLVHCVGPLMHHLWEALPPARRGKWIASAAELAAEAHHLADAGDVLLVKGSKGSKVSLVVDALRKLGQGVRHDTQGTD